MYADLNRKGLKGFMEKGRDNEFTSKGLRVYPQNLVFEDVVGDIEEKKQDHNGNNVHVNYVEDHHPMTW